MLRVIYYSVFIFFILTQSAFAQTVVGVRTGEHGDYSRIVFDWDKATEYSVTSPSAQSLVVKFSDQAALKSAPASSGTANHISGFTVLSEDPLSVSLSFPAGAKTRAFKAGNRVVVDVYAVAGSENIAVKPAPSPAVSTEPTPEPDVQDAENKALSPPQPQQKPAPEVEIELETPEEKKSAEKEPAAAIEQVDAPDAPQAEEPPAAAPRADRSAFAVPSPDDDEEAEKIVVEEEVVEVQDPPSPPPLEVLSETQIKPNVISLSSSESQALAVFEMNGDLWIVNDKADLLLSPQVSGPDAAKLRLETVDIQNGKVFRTKMLEGTEARGQGGGLVWRVVLSGEEHEVKPVKFERKNVDGRTLRSGKIFVPFDSVGKILEVTDPASSNPVKVVTVNNAKLYTGSAHDFVDLTILKSSVGMAVMPKADGVEVKAVEGGIEISRTGGLAIQSAARIEQALLEQERKKIQHSVADINKRRIFNFKNWEMGGVSALTANSNIMLGDMNAQQDTEKVDTLVTLGKMSLANGQGAEALGFLNFAQGLLPELEHNPEFMALHGAASALDLKSEEAFALLSSDALEPFEEIGYWRSFILADLGDWMQAKEVLPEDFLLLYDYTTPIFNRLALVLAEVELRSGEVSRAEELLARLEKNQDSLFEPQQAALSYLKGEAARQRGRLEETVKLWTPLVTGEDDLYRAKAGLALTRLQVNEGKLQPQQAINKMERLRYAWRGDELEAQIYYWLGKTYFETEDYVRGLNILREAAAVAGNTDLGTRIAADMKDVFSELFLDGKLEDVSPLDAVALYEQFAELVPIGPQGDKVVQRLAEHMVEADLLERAENLLSHQVDHRLQGAELHRVGVRLASIYLLDKKPQEALRVLGVAYKALRELPEELQTDENLLEISLLRARSLSQQKRPDQALKLLEGLELTPEVNRLRADIAWNAGYWDDAAEAFDDVILDENISLTRPLSEEHTAMILNRAVALNLASDRVELANMREKYSDLMAQTDKARIFEVITRPRQSAALADRETLMGIVSEVDLFGEFMESYRSAKTLPAADEEEATPPPTEQNQSSESATR